MDTFPDQNSVEKNESGVKLLLSARMKSVIQELGFTSLTPIQTQSIPPLLKGRDLIGQSQTGTGKTLAFSIPALEKIDLKDRKVQTLVLCPTRELCSQVAREMRRLARKHDGLQVLVVSGGQPIYPQITALERGAHIVVGTPGRIMDHLKRKTLSLDAVKYLVLDEADRMLDMGFEDDMKMILSHTPKDRQSVFFSATFPAEIKRLSQAYQRDPVEVKIKTTTTQSHSIDQSFYGVHPDEKFNHLLWVLIQQKPESVIVFCNQKLTVAQLGRTFKKMGVQVSALHGDLEQNDRDRLMAQFRNQSARLLIATDVAARGLDIDSVDLVVNFDFPLQSEIYVHRRGRTGRAGRSGTVVTFVSPQEKHKFKLLKKDAALPELKEFEASDAGVCHEEVFKKHRSLDAKMATLFIGGGRKQKVRPADLLGALTGEAGRLSAQDVGKIEIHDHFSYVAVSENLIDVILKRLRNGLIKGKRFRIERAR